MMADPAAPTGPAGPSLADLNSTQKGGVQNLGAVAQAIQNALPPAASSTSPFATGFNNLGTTGTALIGTSTIRHGLIFHNPGTVSLYVYPTAIATTPTTTSLGGSFLIVGGATREFPSVLFANLNAAWSGFAATGSSNPLTVIEFR